MPESNANIHMLERLVSILGDLVDEMVFVGGSVASLYKEINDEDLTVDIRQPMMLMRWFISNLYTNTMILNKS